MSLPGQTDGLKVVDYVDALEKIAGGGEEGTPIFDYVIYNTERPDENLLKNYARAGEVFVDFSPDDFKDKKYEAIGTSLLGGIVKQNPNDLLKRTLIRHDGEKVARLLMSIAFKPH